MGRLHFVPAEKYVRHFPRQRLTVALARAKGDREFVIGFARANSSRDDISKKALDKFDRAKGEQIAIGRATMVKWEQDVTVKSSFTRVGKVVNWHAAIERLANAEVGPYVRRAAAGVERAMAANKITSMTVLRA